MTSKIDHKLWPFSSRASIFTSAILLIALFVVYAILYGRVAWLPKLDQTTIVIFLGVLSAVPIALRLLDNIRRGGGSVSYAGLKVDFGKVKQPGLSGMSIPANIGVPGKGVSDSGSEEILKALRKATSCDIVLIDLEDGDAWWETRLLVLLAGAIRLGKPDKIAFLGTDDTRAHQFFGWSHPDELLRRLLKSRGHLKRVYHSVQAATRHWLLAEPLEPQGPVSVPKWMPEGLATEYMNQVFDYETGMPNEYFPEQMLAYQLENIIENNGGTKGITKAGLDELFTPVLNRMQIDRSHSADRQMETFFRREAEYFAVTNNGTYERLVSRLAVLNSFVESIVEDKSE